jgi:hypothetical protein
MSERSISANYKDRYDGWEIGNYIEPVRSVAKIEIVSDIVEVKGDEKSKSVRIPYGEHPEKVLDLTREKVRDKKPEDKLIIDTKDR